MENAGLPEAREDLAELVQQLRSDPEVSDQLREEATSTLANARYYMTYLMKLEGLPPAQWEPEIEAARQEYKLLAQTGSDKKRHLNDLEAAISVGPRRADRTIRITYSKPMTGLQLGRSPEKKSEKGKETS